MFFRLTAPRNTWPWCVVIATSSTIPALVLTHAFWPFFRYTPFLLGFVAVVASSRLGGRRGGFLAVLAGALGFASFPPPLPDDGVGPLLLGFVVVSGAFSWLVARRYEIEADLRTSQDRLRAVISSVPIVLWVMNRDGRITLAEGSGLDVLDLTPQELVGRSIFELYREVPEIIANTRRVLGGDTFTAVVTVGETVIETWYSPLRDAQGSVTGAIGVSLDVTTSRRLEEQYLQAQKMQAVGQLAAGIAHDFNNLLTAIAGYAELVIDTLDERDARREDLQEVAKAVQRASALTRHLLSFSRRQILQTTVLDVYGMVADVQKLLRRTVPENIELELELNPTHPVRADRGQLEQVVLNLVVNAGDAMPQGGKLRLSTATVDVDEVWAHRHKPMSAGRYVRLQVSDTGVGMPPKIQARIFEPFFTTKERGRGTGLGLATVYGIVKQSDGFIWVDSRVGFGTTFEIYLPVVHEPVEAAVPVPAAADASGGTQTILLAEDDGAVRRLTRDILAKRGYEVLDARDGDEALAVARQHPGAIDLLITDVVMPGVSGRDLASRLTLERPDLRVLYTSGYTENMMLRSGFENGLTLLAKPFLPAELLQKVSDVLGTTAR
jgi:PAS domain S-box-containing protein